MGADSLHGGKVLRYFSPQLRERIDYACRKYTQDIHEIRIKTDAPVCVRSFGQEFFISHDGTLTSDEERCLKCSSSDIDYSFRAVCENSVYSFAREIREGFITIPGGHRVGICGTAVTDEGEVTSVKNISSLNFRIARQVIGCADRIYREVFSDGPAGLLIAGPPSSGKTTILRDLCRSLAHHYRVCVIDERSEIAAVYCGEPQNDIGALSDVFDGYPKEQGIQTAVRVMAPDIIICDEIGSRADIKALINSLHTGVKIIATVHAASASELSGRSQIMKLVSCGGFDKLVFLDSKNRTGKVTDIMSSSDFLRLYSDKKLKGNAGAL
ncbi:MAG: ATPase, T2SS/T4P/T4SS family [Oscillospiraceae bacterium]|nr:ATPase, T2SS/T4P/T4SS family [Oscillospiraceae bacterium]